MIYSSQGVLLFSTVQKEIVSPSIVQGDGGIMMSRFAGVSLGMLPSVNTTGLGLGVSNK
jgi:hypothetical protein